MIQVLLYKAEWVEHDRILEEERIEVAVEYATKYDHVLDGRVW